MKNQIELILSRINEVNESVKDFECGTMSFEQVNVIARYKITSFFKQQGNLK